MAIKNLLLERENRIMTVTVNRPDKLNALNHDTLIELQATFMGAQTNPEISLVILTGAGEKSFVAGADIQELAERDAIMGQQFSLFGQKIFSMIENLKKPVIAAVNGFALGGGCELAMACHIRIASENAKFGQPEVNLGAIPGYGGTQRLARLVGIGRATELILTGGLIDAQEAHRIGLVNKVVPKGDALAAAKEMAHVILSKSQIAVRFSLEAIQAVPEIGLSDGLNAEAALFGLCCASEDFKEGTKAFLEKRNAHFTGK